MTRRRLITLTVLLAFGILATAAWTNRSPQPSPRPADTTPQRVVCDALGTTCIPLENSPYALRRQS